ncbi:MAG: cytochrome c [Gemmataceae bacterium]
MNLRFQTIMGSAVLLVFALGCGGSDPKTTTPPGPVPAMGGGPPTGNKVFDANCLNCHATQPGGKLGMGPNLAKVGATRTPEWLADHVKDPKSHTPGSKMPEFGSKLKPEELKSVTDFMTGLK